MATLLVAFWALLPLTGERAVLAIGSVVIGAALLLLAAAAMRWRRRKDEVAFQVRIGPDQVCVSELRGSKADGTKGPLVERCVDVRSITNVEYGGAIDDPLRVSLQSGEAVSIYGSPGRYDAMLAAFLISQQAFPLERDRWIWASERATRSCLGVPPLELERFLETPSGYRNTQ